MRQRELDRLLREWQKRLHLQDWNIVIEFSEKPKLRHRFGENFINNENKTSKISILPPELWHDFYEVWDVIYKKGKNAQIRYMVEPTVVHELLHLHVFWYLKPTPLEELLIEQTVSSLEDSFMKLKYKK